MGESRCTVELNQKKSKKNIERHKKFIRKNTHLKLKQHVETRCLGPPGVVVDDSRCAGVR